MLGVGDLFPSFKMKATVSTEASEKAFQDVENATYKGKWLVLFFYPKDFTFVCPTEIAGFGRLNSQFQSKKAQVLACSTDSEFVHRAWRNQEASLKNLPIPMLADIKRELSAALGILDPREGVAQRATFIVDPEGIIRFIYVTDLAVGRSPEEVLRVLEGPSNRKTLPL